LADNYRPTGVAKPALAAYDPNAMQTEPRADDPVDDEVAPVQRAVVTADAVELSGVSAAVRRIFRELAREVESARSGL
jgi:hypothetical protein